jgi:hypothetical protein
MKSTIPAKTMPAPQPFVELLCHWLNPCTLLPNGREGFVTIDSTAYMLGPIVVKGEVRGYRLTKSDGTNYDLPATLDSCECPDHAYRRRKCKHLYAVEMVLADLAAEEQREAALAVAGESWDSWTDADDANYGLATVAAPRSKRTYSCPDWFNGGDVDPAA